MFTAWHSSINNTVYSVLVGWGLSAHATTRGWRLHTTPTIKKKTFHLEQSVSASKRRLTQHMPVPHEQISCNIGEILRETCARFYVEKRRGSRVVRNERMESCQKSFVRRLVWWQLPPVRESSRLKFLQVLMATVINPCCLEARSHTLKVWQLKQNQRSKSL